MTEQRPQRQLSEILAADVAGYSRLIGSDEEGTLARLKALRRTILDPKITENRGRIVKTMGDGLLVQFAGAVDSVRCAVEVQQQIAKQNSEIDTERRPDQTPNLLQEARHSAERALALDNSDASAHHAMAMVCLYARQLDRAGKHFTRAALLNPHDVSIAGDRAQWLRFSGKFDEGLSVVNAAINRDAFPPVWLFGVRGATLFTWAGTRTRWTIFQVWRTHDFTTLFTPSLPLHKTLRLKKHFVRRMF